MSAEALAETSQLAIAIARKLVGREIREVGEVALLNVERAVEMVFRRGRAVIELHPLDLATVEAALGQRPRWSEEFDAVELRASEEVDRGGCLLHAGAGTVDLRIESQLDLIEQALLGDGRDEAAAGPAAAPEVDAGSAPVDDASGVVPTRFRGTSADGGGAP